MFAGDTGPGLTSPAGSLTRVALNKLGEKPSNFVSTIENAEAGLFMMEDAMAQAWQQAMQDPMAQQRDANETFYLDYDYAPPRNSASPGMTMDTPLTVGFGQEGKFGKTFKTTNPGVTNNQFNLNNNPGANQGYNTKAKIESRLAAATLDKDNKGAKVLLHAD